MGNPSEATGGLCGEMYCAITAPLPLWVYLQHSRELQSTRRTLPLRNATSRADRHGHGDPSAPAMQTSCVNLRAC